MYIVNADHAPVNYRVENVEVRDAEGNLVPAAELTYVHKSNNETAVVVTPNPTNPAAASATIGVPKADGSINIATVSVEILSGAKLLGVRSATIGLVPGEPSAISGGDLVFEGLTETVDDGAPTGGS